MNLPHSNAEMKNKSVDAPIAKPVISRRDKVASFIKPNLFDIVREQAKHKIKKTLKYQNTAEAESHRMTPNLEIPESLLQHHIKEYKDYPTESQYKPTTRASCSFG